MDWFLSKRAAIFETVNNFVAEWRFPAKCHLPAQERQGSSFKSVNLCKFPAWCTDVLADNVPVNSKLQHPPGHTPGIWRLFLPGGREFDHHSQGVGNLITSLDIMLRVALIPRGLKKTWRRQTLTNSKEKTKLVENRRPTQALFCIWRCLKPIYIYI